MEDLEFMMVAWKTSLCLIPCHMATPILKSERMDSFGSMLRTELRVVFVEGKGMVQQWGFK